jgi:hypothetical protein
MEEIFECGSVREEDGLAPGIILDAGGRPNCATIARHWGGNSGSIHFRLASAPKPLRLTLLRKIPRSQLWSFSLPLLRMRLKAVWFRRSRSPAAPGRGGRDTTGVPQNARQGLRCCWRAEAFRRLRAVPLRQPIIPVRVTVEIGDSVLHRQLNWASSDLHSGTEPPGRRSWSEVSHRVQARGLQAIATAYPDDFLGDGYTVSLPKGGQAANRRADLW